VTVSPTPEASRNHNRILLVLALGAIALAGAGLFSRRGRVSRVIVLGFDGASPNLMEPLIARGRLPALKRLGERGVYGRMASFRPTKSGVLWTSVATGKTMLKHGVVDWTHVDEAGLDVPFKPSGRTAKTYWEVLGERGISTVTLNWWFSHPARPVRNGIVVSDVFRHAPKPGSVYPPERLAPLAALRMQYPAGVQEKLKRHGLREWRHEDATIPMGGRKTILDSYGVYFAHDVTVERASDYLFAKHPARVFSTYFRLVDITSHFAYHFLDRQIYERAAALEREGRLSPEEEATLDRAYAEILAPTYQYMDRIVGTYMDRMDDATTLIVLSDHGFEFDRGHYRHAQPEGKPPDGILFMAGRGVPRGGTVEGATLFDIAPTVLYLMGQPVAADMDGDVLWKGISGRFAGAHPVRRLASYEGTTGPGPGDAAGADGREELLKDLRTLGYIGGDADAAP
jgi:predicted AlkP superfamily phosphohydrolase/phosphomutase